MENSHDALKYHGNGLYSDEYIKPSSYNPYQENTKILNNDKQRGLSQQYKNLKKQINNKPDNNQHLQTQLKEVRKKISQQTQKDLEDFAKANPDLKSIWLEHRPKAQTLAELQEQVRAGIMYFTNQFISAKRNDQTVAEYYHDLVG